MRYRRLRAPGAVFFAAASLLAISATLNAQGYVRIEGDQFTCDGFVVKIKGTNYYPKNHMWASMWSAWDWGEIVYETQMMRSMGLNAARILVPYSNGGWGGANPPATHLQMLEDIVNHFGANGIRSCVTLFDWETSFPAQGTLTEAQHLSYLSAIVNRLKNNKHVFAWDVKNEPDHPANIYGYDNWDSSPASRDKIVSWLRRMCNAVRAIDTNHPVSAGLRWWQNVQDVLSFVDFAIFHSYWPNISTQEIPDVKSYMGSNQRPILVEEYGWPSNPTPCRRDGQLIYDYHETSQLNLYTSHLNAFAQHNIAGGIQWMTFDAKDYSTDPDESFENYFGLWRYDYSLKPAGVYYRDHAFVPQFLGAFDSTAPAPVAAMTATSEPEQSELRWTNPSDADFVATMIRMSTAGFPATPSSDTAVGLRYAAPGSKDSLVLYPLATGTTYYFSAFARDWSGNWSAVAQATATPHPDVYPPGCVSQFKATCYSTRIRLSWQNPSDKDFKGTMIRYGTTGFPAGPADGALLADRPQSSGTTDALDHTGIVAGVVYYYSAFSYDTAAPANWAEGVGVFGAKSGPMDFDYDGDTDLTDFARFTACFNGPNRPSTLPIECSSTDFDRDGDVDLADFAVFQGCFSGPNRPMSASCAGS